MTDSKNMDAAGGQPAETSAAATPATKGKDQEARTKAMATGRKPSFKTLRREHDTLMLTRSVLLMIGALVLLVPIDFTYLGVKLILLMLLAYAAIFNVKAMREEADMREDKSSRQALVWSYVAFTVVTICFALVTVRAGMAATQYQAALDQALEALRSAGLPTISLK